MKSDEEPLGLNTLNWVRFFAYCGFPSFDSGSIRIASAEGVEAGMAALNDLSPKERQVLLMRFGLLAVPHDRMHTLEEAGAYFNVTRERARQIEAKALRKLRAAAGGDNTDNSALYDGK